MNEPTHEQITEGERRMQDGIDNDDCIKGLIRAGLV